ncbi:hypothetical protein OG562_27225 [Streptomyces sp. NBC_01275]|uniref:hypothetical protein n=1 Tax=Streptomyces sp. NBC_01275 TaxID=2903807 RepID=UPI002257E7D1|nr:hypothetical protein [Streptomyces sp. NBC_01275]MCX4764591.1 hypothetical protein [Streptomyces sp. NBC_01275]
MSTDSGGVLRLPASAIPDGCEAWDGERARRWTRALPPRWVPVRARTSVLVGLPLLGVAAAGALSEFGGLPGWGAAVVGLHGVWLVLRPEAARVLAPVALAVILVPGHLPWSARLGVAAALVLVWAAAVVRLSARGPQRAAALTAAGGVTATPPGTGVTPRRGAFLYGAGLVTVLVGGVLYASAGLWEQTDDWQAVPAVGGCVTGLGLTLLLSALLARRRAAALRRGPVPVLRVLLRENTDLETEVFAADDVAALRPLFTVATTESDEDDEDDDSEDGEEGEEGSGDGEDEDDDEELRELFDRIDEGRSGPLREAVLYGTPYDGAELVFLAAAEMADEPPGIEVSVGPVRPVTEWAVRRRVVAEKGRSVREAHYEKRRRAAAEAVAERARDEGPVEVRRWGAGWADWFAVALAVLWGFNFWEDSGWWRYASGLGLTLIAALLLPRRLAWRITADSAGLWFNGFRRTGHIAWDDIRVVRCTGVELKIDSKRASFEEWSVHTPRWPWLEHRLGVLHPYERTAAELAAMWQDPALRPVGTVDARRRGGLLWPLGVVFGAVGLAVVLFLP